MEQEFEPLNTKVTKAVINGSIYDIMDYDEYSKVRNNCSVNNVAVKYSKNGNDMVLPVKGTTYNDSVTTPGVYKAGPLDFFVLPTESNINQYKPKKIVEISNTDSMKTILEKEEVIGRLTEPWITSPDNITTFPIYEDDHPEMVALKKALNAKNIDFDKYASRFGANFPNDKRQLKNTSATLNILKRFCENCDIECEIVLRDKNPLVPNPMGSEVRVKLTDSPEIV